MEETVKTLDDRRPIAERPVPANKLTPEEEQQVLDVVNSPEFRDQNPYEIVHTLFGRDIYLCSESTIYRILHKRDLVNHRGRAAVPQRRDAPSLSASAPNQVWMWDITYIPGPVKGEFYFLYLISDLYSRYIVGYEIWPEQSGENASILIERAANSEHILSTQLLVLHSDNGSPMKAYTMLETLIRHGIIPSYSRPRVSNDNAYAESLFRTLKFFRTYKPNGFASLEEARAWAKCFVNYYNYEHHHRGINFLTPNERHNCDWRAILAKRQNVLEEAKLKHPERWNNRNVRDCTAPEIVYLNPVNTDKKS